MILEIDAGNTRAKWRIRSQVESEQFESREPNAVLLSSDPAIAAKMLVDKLQETPMESVTDIWISNVRGAGFSIALSESLGRITDVKPVFPIPIFQCAGVTNGYAEPEKLGVDRWMSILAAYHLVQGSVCVVDCGTTITVDIVSAIGDHLGGYIVPGVSLMKNALAIQSSVLQSNTAAPKSTNPGRCTADAIDRGVIAMCAAFVERIRTQSYKETNSPELVITGGDARILEEYISYKCTYRPALVLDGLRLACNGFHVSSEAK